MYLMYQVIHLGLGYYFFKIVNAICIVRSVLIFWSNKGKSVTKLLFVGILFDNDFLILNMMAGSLWKMNSDSDFYFVLFCFFPL